MKIKRDFFEGCPEEWRDGYLIPVRNRLGNMIEREYLPKEMKEAFFNQFGEKIIFDDDFVEWYVSMKKA
jgi:hypothetical protein